MNYKKILKISKFIFIFAVILGNLAVAGDRSKYGTSAAPELLIPVGSRGTSLSGAILSNVTGVESMYWNPAGLSVLETRTEMLFSHMRYIADININYFAGAVDLGGLGVIGASLKTMSFPEEYVTTNESPEGTGEMWSPTYLTASLSYARKMSDKILFGATTKLIYENIMKTSATGFAVDLGLQYIAGESGFKFGVALKNFGPSMKFDGTDLDAYFEPPGTPTGSTTEPRRITLQDFSLPTTLEIGASYMLPFAKRYAVELSTAFQNNNYSSDEYRVGLEFNYNKLFYLRGAYVYTPDYDTKDERLFGPSFGAGIHYPVGGVSFGLDYAYRLAERFKDTQWFTLSVGF
jgi:hypothetical protein